MNPSFYDLVMWILYMLTTKWCFIGIIVCCFSWILWTIFIYVVCPRILRRLLRSVLKKPVYYQSICGGSINGAILHLYFKEKRYIVIKASKIKLRLFQSWKLFSLHMEELHLSTPELQIKIREVKGESNSVIRRPFVLKIQVEALDAHFLNGNMKLSLPTAVISTQLGSEMVPDELKIQTGPVLLTFDDGLLEPSSDFANQMIRL